MARRSIVGDQDSDWAGFREVGPRESRLAEMVAQFGDMLIGPSKMGPQFRELTRATRTLTVYEVSEQRRYRQSCDLVFARLI